MYMLSSGPDKTFRKFSTAQRAAEKLALAGCSDDSEAGATVALLERQSDGNWKLAAWIEWVYNAAIQRWRWFWKS